METLVTPGGEDTIHLSYYCRFTDAFKTHLKQIAAAKKLAQNPPRTAGLDEEPPQPVFACGDNIYVVQRDGIAPNKAAAKFCYYPYVMKDGGIVIAIQPVECRGGTDVRVLEEDEEDEPVELTPGNFPTEADDEMYFGDMVPVSLPGDDARRFKKKRNSTRPNIRVEIGALPLIAAGSAENIMPLVEQRLIDLGLIIVKNRLARVDACVDIPVAVTELQVACVRRHYRTRARSVSAYNNLDDWGKSSLLMATFDDDTPSYQTHSKGQKETGFSIGRNKVMCRGYDKLEKERHCEEMLEALKLRRFGGGELSEQLTRIEFQLRRDALRGITVLGIKDGIETWQDWVAHKAAIVSYLCNDWLIFTSGDFNRNHSERLNDTDYHPDWALAVGAFKRAFGETDQKISRIQKSIKRESVSAIAQAIGNDQSAMIKTGIDLSPHDPNWIQTVAAFRYATTVNFFSDPEKQKAFWENWRNKVLMQEASIPDDALVDVIPFELTPLFDLLPSMASTGVDVIQTQPRPSAGFEPPAAFGGGAGASGPAPDATA